MPKFKAGVSGNPKGKKIGTLNRRTQLAKLFEPHAEALVNKAVELAIGGDAVALRLCIERLIPRAVEKPVTVMLPDLMTLPHNNIIPELLGLLSGQNVSLADVNSLIKICSLQGSEFNREDSLQRVAEIVKELNKHAVCDY